jgi:hypothetical protein
VEKSAVSLVWFTRFWTGLTQWACIVLVSTATHLTYSHSEHMKV